MEYKELNKQFQGQYLWAGGYFAASSGNATNEIIREYIKNQDMEEKTKSDNFDIGQLQAASAAKRTYRLQLVVAQFCGWEGKQRFEKREDR